MSKKDDKPTFNPDYSRITIPEKTITRSSKPRLNSQEKRLQDLILFIPSKEKQNAFISKTIEECTGREFMRWANYVFAPLLKSKDYYDIKRNREDEFLNILEYHRELFIRANPEARKTLH